MALDVPNQPGRQEGQGLVEYALIIFLVTLVILGIVILFGGSTAGLFSTITGSL